MSSVDIPAGPSDGMPETRTDLISPEEWLLENVEALRAEAIRRQELRDFFDFGVLGISPEDRQIPQVYRRGVYAFSDTSNPSVMYRGDGWGWCQMIAFHDNEGNPVDGWVMEKLIVDRSKPVPPEGCIDVLLESRITRADESTIGADTAIELLDQMLRDLPQHPERYHRGKLLIDPLVY